MYEPLLSGPRLQLASALAMLVSWDVKQMEDVCVLLTLSNVFINIP